MDCAGKLSKSADVYAFGVLLWEMWTGQRPWSGLGQMQVIFHLTQRKKRLQFPPDTPKRLQVLCLSSVCVVDPHHIHGIWFVTSTDTMTRGQAQC